VTYDAQGREVQKDYFDPGVGLDTHQIVTRPDGSRTAYSFNDQGKVYLQIACRRLATSADSGFS
jgi:hypothetical protein